MKTLVLLLTLFTSAAASVAKPYDEGLQAIHAGNWQLAVTKLTESQTRSPNALTLYLLAVALSHENDAHGTETYARQALSYSPSLDTQYREPASRLIGWATAIQYGGISATYTMSSSGGLTEEQKKKLAEHKAEQTAQAATLKQIKAHKDKAYIPPVPSVKLP
jgi:hypothetical protein